MCSGVCVKKISCQLKQMGFLNDFLVTEASGGSKRCIAQSSLCPDRTKRFPRTCSTGWWATTGDPCGCKSLEATQANSCHATYYGDASASSVTTSSAPSPSTNKRTTPMPSAKQTTFPFASLGSLALIVLVCIIIWNVTKTKHSHRYDRF